jgi:hypothetical protein
MSRWQRVLAAAAVVAALVCAAALLEFTLPAPAHASAPLSTGSSSRRRGAATAAPASLGRRAQPFIDGSPKPSLDAFRLPIWLPRPRHGSSVAVWGQLRPAAHHGSQAGELEFLRRGSAGWQPLSQVQTGDPQGYFLIRARIPAAGLVRLSWVDPSGTTDYSRSVAVS